jgi:hypothetical protein
MIVSFSDTALDKIFDIAEFVDDINTPGAGDRWIERMVDFIKDYAKLSHIQWPLCRNENLATHSYNCLVYKNWIIAFKIESSEFKIYDLIYGSLLD